MIDHWWVKKIRFRIKINLQGERLAFWRRAQMLCNEMCWCFDCGCVNVFMYWCVTVLIVSMCWHVDALMPWCVAVLSWCVDGTLLCLMFWCVDVCWFVGWLLVVCLLTYFSYLLVACFFLACLLTYVLAACCLPAFSLIVLLLAFWLLMIDRSNRAREWSHNLWFCARSIDVKNVQCSGQTMVVHSGWVGKKCTFPHLFEKTTLNFFRIFRELFPMLIFQVYECSQATHQCHCVSGSSELCSLIITHPSTSRLPHPVTMAGVFAIVPRPSKSNSTKARFVKFTGESSLNSATS
jgi:hypothetical protein